MSECLVYQLKNSKYEPYFRHNNHGGDQNIVTTIVG